MGEAGEFHLVAAWDVEAKLALPEIGAGLRPAIHDGPAVAVLDLMDDLSGADADVERVEAVYFEMMGRAYA